MMKTVFYRDGKPFFPLGGQCHNSSSQSAAQLEVSWQALKALRANTAEVPVYWNLLEPEEGVFDFTQTDMIFAEAGKHGFCLILLWFGTWKNGKMQYTPDWVKQNSERFHRVITHDGFNAGVLSSHCKANLEADKKAFAALTGHIKKMDTAGLVIGFQVENEPGIDARAVRDHGPEGEAEYQSAVPVELVNHIAALPVTSRVRKAWAEAGEKKQGNWPELFGYQGGEFLSAWSVAKYINAVAHEGKKIVNLPMIVNVWNGDGGFNQPGIDYPSGGAAAKVLDLWKFASPDIDILGPDIYHTNIGQFDSVCAAFDRQDNPLFLPESLRRKPNEWGIISAVGRHHAVGYNMFGVEDILLEDSSVRPELQSVVDSFAMVSDAIPLIIANHGNIHPIIQEEGMTFQLLELDGHVCNVQFREPGKAYYTHRWPSAHHERGRGFLFQTGAREFYCIGDSFFFDLRKKPILNETEFGNYCANPRNETFLKIEEGHFDGNGDWQTDRVRTGDDLDFGIWMYAGNRVVHIVLCD
ncbi:beta-galactosidase [Spirochaetia bacterium]|nr:beta-galactosidase [Spirochaetia bacterium]